MGQRHQAYIIARVIPHGGDKPNYRCVGALHDQWCYGSLPLKAATRFIKLIKQKEHAEVILEEIKALNGKYGSNLDKPPLIPDNPCPLASFLLHSAWSIDFHPPNSEDMYLSDVRDFPTSLDISDGGT